jgi:hypothetical protein
VLMTSCHVSLKPNRGPVMAYTRMMATARKKAMGRPVTCDTHLAKRTNQNPLLSISTPPWLYVAFS